MAFLADREALRRNSLTAGTGTGAGAGSETGSGRGSIGATGGFAEANTGTGEGGGPGSRSGRADRAMSAAVAQGPVAAMFDCDSEDDDDDDDDYVVFVEPVPAARERRSSTFCLPP